MLNAPCPLIFEGNSIRDHLKDATYVAVLAVTIGDLTEAASAKSFAQGDYTKGLLLDAAGTTAVEKAANEACLIIDNEAKARGCQLTTRFSPGYGDFAITVQSTILALVGANKINISATSSAMLVPRKSITAVIGLTPHKTGISLSPCTNTCQSCNQINCIARKEN